MRFRKLRIAWSVACGILCLVVSYVRAVAATEEEQGRRIAEAAIKTGAIDYLTDREFKLDGPKIKLSARAIDPKESVKIELKEFKLLLSSVELKFKITAPFLFEGTVKSEDGDRELRGKGDISQLVSMQAKYWFDRQGLQVEAKATDIEFSGKIVELTPEDVGGGKSAVGKLIVGQLQRQKDELLRSFNEWQAEYERKSR
jgi:hypothetical protein